MKKLLTLTLITFLSVSFSFAETEPNDTQAQANPMALFGTESGDLFTNPATDATDWFYTVVNDDGIFTLTATYQAGVSGWIYLHEKDGTQLSFTHSGSVGTIRTFSVSVSCFASDTIYMRITRNAGSGSYSISNNLIAPANANDLEPNNNQAQIQNTYLENQIFTGHLGYTHAINGTDANDYYYIIAEQDGNVTLTAEYDSSFSGYIYIDQKNGSALTNNYSGAITNVNRTFSTTAFCRAADTLMIRINRNAGCGSYRAWFEVDTLTESNDVEPNNNIASINSMFLENVFVTGHLGYIDVATGRDSEDYYYILAETDGNIQLTAEFDAALAGYIYIYEKDGSQLVNAYSGAADTVNRIFSTTAFCRAADSLIVRVSYASGCGAYRISFDDIDLVTQANIDLEPNSMITQIQETFLEGDTIDGHLGYIHAINGNDNDDYYYIIAETDGDIELTAEFDAALAGYIYLYEKDGTQLTFTYSGGLDTVNRTFSTTSYCRAADTLIVRIGRAGGCGSYRAIFADNDLVTEANLDIEPNSVITQIKETFLENDTINGHLGYIHALQGTDNEDYYYIIPDKDGNVTLTAEYDARLAGYIYLYEKDGSQIGFTYSGGVDTVNRIFSYTGFCRAADSLIVRISKTAGCGSYRASFSIDTLDYSNDIEPNHSIAQIQNTFLENDTFAGHLGYIHALNGTDNDDYFYIVAAEDGSVTLTAEYDGPLAGYIYLYEKDGSQISFTYSGGADTVSRTFSVTAFCRTADTLVARIYRTSGCGAYSASFVINRFTYEFSNDVEENGSFATAIPIKMSAEKEGHIGNIHAILGTDSDDYYKLNVVSVPFDLKAKLHLAEAMSGNFYLYNSAFSPISILNVSGPQNIDLISLITIPGTYYLRLIISSGCGSYKIGDFCGTPPPAPTISASGDTIFCQGDSVTLTSSPAYGYIWNTGDTIQAITVSTSGIYSVSILDSNCCVSDPTQITVIVNPLPSCVATGTDVLCFGGNTGSANVAASLGTSPYSFAWSNNTTNATAGNLGIGTYTVTVTDVNGCTTTCDTVINQPSLLVAECVESSNVSCHGDSTGLIAASAFGGTPPYTYVWSSGQTGSFLSNLPANTYTLTVTDFNGCTATCVNTITEPPLLTLTCTTDNDVSCNGGSDGSASATAQGGTPAYNYSWSNGQTTATAIGIPAGTYTVTASDNFGCSITCEVTVTEPPVLTVQCNTNNDVSCNGGSDGSASATAQGGIPAYNYSWSDGQTSATATGLTAGTYMVTVMDANGCTATCSVTISEPPGLNANCSSTDVTTSGGSDGSATVSATGGTLGYTYAWSNTETTQSISGLTAGTYTVIVTDGNSCTTSCQATVNDNALPLSVNCSVNTGISCNGAADGIVEVMAINGAPPYSYTWSDGQTNAIATGLNAGTYVVTVTDNNGSSSCSISLIDPAQLMLTSSKSNVNCFGGSDGTATVIASGGNTPYSYNWNTNPIQTTNHINGLGGGLYTATVTDAHSCSQTVSINIRVPSNLFAFYIPTNPSTVGASDGSINLMVTGGVAVYSHLWTNGSTLEDLANVPAGVYTCTTTDKNNCAELTTVILIDPFVPFGNDNFNKMNNSNSFTVYPNPTSERLFVEFNLNEITTVNMAVYNILGERVRKEKLLTLSKQQNIHSIDLAGLLPGMYFVNIKGEGITGNKKFIIE